ncbi:MAG: tRNA lysidine(34) synthetase TilS [Cyanobacteria bacterium]|nr:tRNA lysidine(34) synthetase TilS [Cyanobacteriota bacterium]
MAVNWSPFHAHIHQTLKTRGLLPQGCRVLVGVSGGQDSLALMCLLADLQPHWQWHLQGIHCNHGWRQDADANARFVVQTLAAWQIDCAVVTAEPPPQGEAAARQWRYGAFYRVACRDGCQAVVTGHTASDRAETLLYNLIRGSGADGLQALTWQRPLQERDPKVQLVRPLLNCTRAQITEFCQTQMLSIWEDSTNCDRTYARNRLRLDLLPWLRQHFNPQVDRTLAQAAEILSAEVDYLDTQTDLLWQQCWDTSHHCLDRRVLALAPLALQRRVLYRWVKQIAPRQIRFTHVEKLVVLITAPNRSQTDPFPGGAIARVSDPWIEILQTNPGDSLHQDDSETD